MIRVYNSLTRSKEEFTPLKEGHVTMYVCGPTVYDMSHIGHARSAVAFDIIYRYLKYKGYKVQYARNYTDIDDKIIKRANADGKSAKEIAERYIKAFDEDMSSLAIELPDHRPKATETIGDIVVLINILIDKGYAYAVERGDDKSKKSCDVYYRVRSFAGYGELSGKDIEELEAGARVEVDVKKEDPLDFALWKTSKPGEPSWKSPWGMGRPGWHIECSAMSQRFLGDTIDIHGGGKDLIFPHHENERAQSEAATGKAFVKYWLHNGFVNIDKEKMSKSVGNFLLISEALKAYHPQVMRLFFLSSHYTKPIDYSEQTLKDIEAGLNRGYLTLERIANIICQPSKSCIQIDTTNLKGLAKEVYEKTLDLKNGFEKAMDDDFNTAIAIGQIFDLMRMANRLMDDKPSMKIESTTDILAGVKNNIEELGEVLGIFTITPSQYQEDKLERFFRSSRLSRSDIMSLIEKRKEARKNRDFKLADEIRSGFDKEGLSLGDTLNFGTSIRVKD